MAGLFYLGQLVIVVLGAMTLTAEYSTGMIRTSLTAMPRRTVVYAAKAIVFAVVALVVTFVAAFVSFFLGQALLASTHDTATLSQPNVLRAVVGSALYVTLCGLFAFAIGAILRHTAGAITAVIGLLFVIPILVHLLPQSWYQDVARWLPDAAGRALSVTVGPPPAHLFSAWNQFAVFAIYTAVLLVVGADPVPQARRLNPGPDNARAPDNGSVRISWPSSVTRMVCSNCAVRRRSLVTAVQPSGQTS